MCDITKTIVCVPVPGCTLPIMSNFLIQDVLLKFSLCSLVVLDDGIYFKGAFIAMCTALYLCYDIIVARNHKVFYVECFNRF